MFTLLCALVKFAKKKKIIFLKKLPLPPAKIIYASGPKSESTLATQTKLSSIKGRDERYIRNEN